MVNLMDLNFTSLINPEWDYVSELIRKEVLQYNDRSPSSEDIEDASIIKWDAGKPKLKNVSPNGFKVGDKVRIGLEEGEIIEINNTSLRVKTENGIKTWNEKAVRMVKHI